MLRHNFKLFFRNIKKYKTTFLINIIGLSSGLACVLLIYLWVTDELRVDKFHTNNERLYQVLRNIKISDGDVRTFSSNSDLLTPVINDELSEVEYAAPVTNYKIPTILSAGNKKIKGSGELAGENFFKIFSFPLIDGNKDQALKGKNSIVISKKMALALFNRSKDLIGEVINIVDNSDGEMIYAGDYNISGVVDTERISSSLKFDYLLTNELFLAKRDLDDKKWNSNGVNVYLTLKKGIDLTRFQTSINSLYRSKLEAFFSKEEYDYIGSMFVQRYSDRYLYNRFENGKQAGGKIDYVWLFSIIAVIILLIACINFMNLSTAQASERLKEIGVKKAIGASKKTLVFQYISEALFLAFLSLFIAIVLVFLLLPEFNLITGKQISMYWDTNLVIGILMITLFTGLISGSYPAFYLSQLKPIETLKSKIKTSFGELITRKALVVFQFGMSILFIVSVIVVSSQINYAQSKNLGYDRERILTFEKEGKLTENPEPFLEEVRNTLGVVSATILEGSASNFNNSAGSYKQEGKDYIQFTFARVGYDYVKTLGIEMKEGRSFSKKFGDERSKIILNEAAIAEMKLENPVGKIVNIRGNREVIGIVKDFHFQSLHEKIKPMFLIFVPEDADKIAVKIQAGSEQQTMARLRTLYQKFNPRLSFDFKFLDDEYQALYVSEQRVASLSKYFAVIAILISCLGLFGLAMFTATKRRKEIGIRRTLGQKRSQIILLLSREFTKLVGISILIGLPLAFLLMKNWLSEFAYRIDLKIEYFLFTAFIAVVVALATVASQAIRAANKNPIEALREE